MAQIHRPRSSNSPARSPLEIRDNNSLNDKRLPSPLSLPVRGDSLMKPSIRMQSTPASPVSINPPHHITEPSQAQVGAASPPQEYATPTHSASHSRHASKDVSMDTTPRESLEDSSISVPQKSFSNLSLTDRPSDRPSSTDPIPRASSRHSAKSSASSVPYLNDVPEDGIPQQAPTLQYHHQPYETPTSKAQRASQMTLASTGSSSSGEQNAHLRPPRNSSARPHSMANLAADARGRREFAESLSPNRSPRGFARGQSGQRMSPDMRPMSYIDLLNEVPYHQQVAPAPLLNNTALQATVGANASLLDTAKTLAMYRANVKKTNDSAIQYEFAIFMINAARDAMASGQDVAPGNASPVELIKEARDILVKLADRGYPFAQYYVADGYASGFFNNQKPSNDKAFPLFVAASKHGHAEAGYRAALCYEFGWGTAKSSAKAAQFYRNAASKGHPGAAVRLGKACLTNDMGQVNKYKEGVKWLKRASEGADLQYNAGPYELGLLHITGFGEDIFRDETYAAQLLTQSAELGHGDANYRMGQAYELGMLGCPKDAALSIHFYNGAATQGVPEAMLALCAWYMVGAEPVLEKSENEAYEWAKQAAELGLAKAEYATAYFTEMGIGCRSDPLEANMWYVRAADHGSEHAKQRIGKIRAAATGGDVAAPMEKTSPKAKELADTGAADATGKEKECIVM